MALDAGDVVYAEDLVWPESVDDSRVSFLQTTSTTYTDAVTGGTDEKCWRAFAAPPTGHVLLCYNATLFNSSSTGATFVTPIVRTGGTIGSGTVVLTAHDDRAIRVTGTGSMRYGATWLLTGLTPGEVYHAQLLHRVASGATTGTVDERTIIVVPVW